MLTPVQKKTLEFIRSYQRKENVSPTISVLCKNFRISKGAVVKRLRYLEAAGAIERKGQMICFDPDHFCQCQK